MQIYRLNRTIEGYKAGTKVVRLQDLPPYYRGGMTVQTLYTNKRINVARSRCDLVRTTSLSNPIDRMFVSRLVRQWQSV